MEVLETIAERYSCRAFTTQPVTASDVRTILDVARRAPSGVNTQPWKVVVVGQALQKSIGDAIVAQREAQIPENPDYHYYPEEWFSPYKERRKACGAKLYGALNIAFEDKAARKAQWYRNYYFFGAPVGLLFFLDSRLEKGSWMDLGMFLENIMLAARGLGLETCAQASLSEYPDVVRALVGIDPSYTLVCGMAMGYADTTHPINQFRTDREPVDDFTTWLL